ncbi:MAG: NAD-dependent malic enzyme [Alphaproteobacteria bacterium]|nr:MAG: NAD-dependent malic enzyme [Alphaproteobacteria bacterium]
MKKFFNRVAAKFRAQVDKWLPSNDQCEPRGYVLMDAEQTNKSTAFTREERDEKGLRGLLPHKISTQDEQRDRALENLRRKTSPIEKYIDLSNLQDRNERLFYYTALSNIEEVMPLIYTPTVGEACEKFSHIFRKPRGMYITPDDKGKVREMLDNWPHDDVRVIVITDGERILGLGDLGANGMGIPIGKLALYTVCGGIDPAQCMPVMFDIGTNNEKLRNDPLYLGYPQERVRGKAYDALMQEFVEAVQEKFPKAVIQFEDFKTENAFRLLNQYRDKVTCFNDDIQGTAAVALAGVLASGRITGQDFKDQRIMFLGAGSAATGIADLMVKELQEKGLSEEEARKRISLVDSKGLVTKGRAKIEDNKKPFAQDHAPASLLEAINDLKPTVLIGATGVANTFTKEVVEAMSAINDRPVIFALSNPTSHAECTAQQAYEWSKGKAIFASGSPFDAVEYNGQTFKAGQGNNAYIFPGLGLGVVLSESEKVTDNMFLAAAKALAAQVTDEDLKTGTLYPPLSKIRDVSAKIATAVIVQAGDDNVFGVPQPPNCEEYVKKHMYNPSYDAGTPAPESKPAAKPQPKPAPGTAP